MVKITWKIHLGAPFRGKQGGQISSLKVKKVGIKRVGFSGIASLAPTRGIPDERTHVGINAAFMHQRNFGRTIQQQGWTLPSSVLVNGS